MTDLVYIANGKTWTDSVKLAEAFGKLHKNVVRKIEQQLTEYSNDFQRLNFELMNIVEENAIGMSIDKSYYRLSRDGFMAVGMAFTGKTAAAFRETILREFNAMEQELISLGHRALPITVEGFLAMSHELKAANKRAYSAMGTASQAVRKLRLVTKDNETLTEIAHDLEAQKTKLVKRVNRLQFLPLTRRKIV